MTKYRKLPVVIDAIQWDGKNLEELFGLDVNADFEFSLEDGDTDVYIKTLEGLMIATKGDYIIKGIRGEIYPCKPDIFEATYERWENK